MSQTYTCTIRVEVPEPGESHYFRASLDFAQYESENGLQRFLPNIGRLILDAALHAVHDAVQAKRARLRKRNAVKRKKKL